METCGTGQLRAAVSPPTSSYLTCSDFCGCSTRYLEYSSSLSQQIGLKAPAVTYIHADMLLTGAQALVLLGLLCGAA